MRKFSICVLILNLFFITSSVKSQEDIPEADSLKINSSTFYKAVGYTAAYYAGSLFILSKTWYKDRPVVPFHFYNDTGGYLQVDKLGHIYGAYVYSYIGFQYLLNSGLTRKEALYFGSTLGLILQTPIEIMDGIHEGYGFSWGDMAANAIGSALVFGQEVLFKEQAVKYKFSYSESAYADKANGYLGKTALDRLLKDYNGHTYWLSMPVNKIVNNSVIPPWLNIAIGYGAGGMYGEFENIKNYNGVEIPAAKRYRQYFLSLDIDWTKIKTDSRILQIILNAVTFIKLPFPAIEFNSLGEVKYHWIYY
ncbi:MAG: DUF2279 domain-containing protein [Ignavibacteriae bacterium HGW-Ignavibacteriae-3]|nr:MAG: DUF2279 domain-containing protein [Ignavibacteriae bacterium HGW-Ignavibacteriae-3]